MAAHLSRLLCNVAQPVEEHYRFNRIHWRLFFSTFHIVPVINLNVRGFDEENWVVTCLYHCDGFLQGP